MLSKLLARTIKGFVFVEVKTSMLGSEPTSNLTKVLGLPFIEKDISDMFDGAILQTI